jgi:two-component system, chemotaxis family, sensor kinase CheA
MAKDPYRYFRIEARELLDQLVSGVLELEKGAQDADLPLRLLRFAHTLKGAARVVKQAKIAELSHMLEDALALNRDDAHADGRRNVDQILALLDAMRAHVAQIPQAEAAPTAVAEAETPVRALRTDIAEVETLLDGLGQIGGGLVGVRRSLASVKRARDLSASLADQLASLQTSAMQAPDQVTKIDDLSTAADRMHNLIVAAERGLNADVEVVERELRQAHDTAQRLRLSPVSVLFSTLERTARDAAHSLGKRVGFHASGGDVRLDAQVLDAIQSALIQIVRNAVAHGIESETERRAAGKAPEGRVTLDVSRRGYRVCFRCTDDGRGVDLDAVRRALQRKGVLAPGAQERDEADLLGLLLRGGISTSSNVSEISGRGIGLDVVRDAMRQLGGDAAAKTTPGGGTSIELRVPVSLASLDVLSVQVDGQMAAIPLEAVHSTMHIAPADVMRSAQGNAIAHQGALIPLVRSRLGSARSAERSSPTQAMVAVIVSAAGILTALVVDKLHGTERVVVRPLPALAVADASVSGIHLDADGNPRMVLDPAILAAGQRITDHDESKGLLSIDPILVIDDSLTTRMLECSILESAGFAVEIATSGEEALDMAQRKRYALFLVDVEMPGMSGFEFIERTRADSTLSAVPCILVTSRDSPEDRRRGEAAGASAHIVKSAFEQVEFLQRVSRLVRP